MTPMVRTVTVQVGWLALALIVAAVALLVLAVRRPVAPAPPPPPAIDPARIRQACGQYAGLDLSGWAAICADAGYQQTVTVPPLAPEDLGRPSP